MGYSESNLQRRMEIENVFLQLMREQSFDAITVKDLTQQIRIARKTFYSYFPNKHACLDSLTDRLIYECTLDILRGMPDHLDLSCFFRIWVEFWLKNRNYLEAIQGNHMNEYLVQRLIRYITKEYPDSPQAPTDGDMLYFYISGLVALMMKWCREGFPLPPEEMASKLLRLAGHPLIR